MRDVNWQTVDTVSDCGTGARLKLLLLGLGLGELQSRTECDADGDDCAEDWLSDDNEGHHDDAVY